MSILLWAHGFEEGISGVAKKSVVVFFEHEFKENVGSDGGAIAS